MGPFIMRDEKRGKLWEEKWFAAPTNSGTRRLIRRRKSDYEYTALGAPNVGTDPNKIRSHGIRVGVRKFDAQNAPHGYVLIDATGYGTPILNWNLAKQITEEYEYNNVGASTARTTTQEFKYHDRGFLYEDKTTVSHGQTISDVVSTTYKYPRDYANMSGDPWLQNMLTWRQWNYPIEVIKRRSGKVVGVTAYRYDRATVTATKRLNLSAPLTTYPTDGHIFNSISADWRQTNSAVLASTGVLPETSIDENNRITSTMWGYHYTLPVAVVSNATYKQEATSTELAFENFEGVFEPLPWTNTNGSHFTGERHKYTNWQWVSEAGGVITSPLLDVNAHTGKYSLSSPNLRQPLSDQRSLPLGNLPASVKTKSGGVVTGRPNIEACAHPPTPEPIGSTAPNNPLAGQAATMVYNAFSDHDDPFWCLHTYTPNAGSAHTRTYTISCWAKANYKEEGPGWLRYNSPFVALWGATCSTAAYLRSIPEDGKWHYISHTFTPSGAPDDLNVLVGGNNVLLDDLLLVPADAQVTTYTHEPHLGVTSIIDENNQTTHFEYDGFGRLRATYDNDGNLLQAHQYKLQQP